MSFKENDFLYIEYDLIDKEANKLVATTNEAKAKEANVYKKEMHYGKSLFIVGSEANLKGLNKEIKNLNLNESKDIILKPDEAFGDYDKNLIKVMHLSDFKSHDINPYPGMEVNIDNKIALIKAVNSGRVIVDFNNQLAGRELIFKIKITDFFNSDEDKIKALSEYENIKLKNIKIKENSCEISFGPEINKNESYFIKKQYLIDSIFKYLNIEKVNIIEEYEKQKRKIIKI